MHFLIYLCIQPFLVVQRKYLEKQINLQELQNKYKRGTSWADQESDDLSDYHNPKKKTNYCMQKNMNC